jgi:uncharacterized membrane protein YhhN
VKSKFWNRFSKIVFFGIAALELLAHLLPKIGSLAQLTKPLLMPALAFLFYSQTRPHYLNKHVYLALFFAWLGDCCLMFVNKNSLFFMLGLGFFLLMQLLYVYMFKSLSTRLLQKKLPYVLAVVLCSVLVLWLVWPQSGSLKIPIVLYFLAILAMVLSALGYWARHHRHVWVFVGAALFMLSDSLIALNKFYSTLPLAGFLVMATYIAAQYLIVSSLAKR